MKCAATMYVLRLATTATFYQECFGFEVVDVVAGDYTVLESDTWRLDLVQVPAAIAQTITITDPPRRRQETPIKLAFEVASIRAQRPAIAAGGGRADESEWTFRGYKHCDFVDPEGNVGQLRERIVTGP